MAVLMLVGVVRVSNWRLAASAAKTIAVDAVGIN